MSGRYLVVASILCVARPAAAQEPPLEAALGQLRGEALAVRAKLALRKETSGKDLFRMADELASASKDTRRLRETLADLRSRVGAGPNADPNFRRDLNRFLWDLNALESRLLGDWADLDELYRGSRPNLELAAPAKTLEREASGLAAEADALREEAHSAVSEFQRAGYWVDVWNMERQAGGVSRQARHLRIDASRLRGRIEGRKEALDGRASATPRSSTLGLAAAIPLGASGTGAPARRRENSASVGSSSAPSPAVQRP